MTRTDSKGTVPTGVKAIQVNFDDEDSLISALKGQEFLIITLAVMAPQDLHGKIVKAAGKAGVPYIMPNAYGWDVQNEQLANEALGGTRRHQLAADITNAGSSYIIMCCGFWYEWSLALGEPWYGFDIKNKKVTFFDDGTTQVSSSTWDQCGRALAALLSLPISDPSQSSLDDFKNKYFYIDSFLISQRDILDSLNRVTKTTDKDWQISHESTPERYQKGLDEMKNGVFTGFPKVMYTRCFYPNGGGDFTYRGLSNDVLGLSKENIDEFTKRAVDMVESGWNPFA